MFVLFDNENGMFLTGSSGYGKPAKNSQEAKIYKYKKSAVNCASLHNISRNIPPGGVSNKHYSNRPQVEVQELDTNFNILRVHNAPPEYLAITVSNNDIIDITTV